MKKPHTSIDIVMEPGRIGAIVSNLRVSTTIGEIRMAIGVKLIEWACKVLHAGFSVELTNLEAVVSVEESLQELNSKMDAALKLLESKEEATP